MLLLLFAPGVTPPPPPAPTVPDVLDGRIITLQPRQRIVTLSTRSS